MSPSYERLTIDQVKAGDELPPLSVDVTATTIVLGALASRDWRPMHHDKDFAINRNGTKDIFMNSPNQASWFERYLTDWAGPTARLGRIKFRMHNSVFPDDTITFKGAVDKVETDVVGCSWASVSLTLMIGDTVGTTFSARLALPSKPGDNPWARQGDDWKP
jgi:acyl dehydratase